MSVKVQLKGGKEVTAALETLADSGRLVRREVLGSSLAIQKEAKQRVRDYEALDTGNLRNSILAETTPNGLTGEIGPKAPYGVYVELGARPHFPPMAALEDWARKHGFKSAWPICKAIARRGLPARPYLYPAFDNEEPKFLARLKAIYENLK